VRTHVADASDADALAEVFTGWSTVVNLTAGSPAGMIRCARAIYDACRRVGVARLIHLSSAVVFGDLDITGASDDSPPLLRHWMPYARAKSRIEVFLRDQMGRSDLDIVVLRPGIVWSPDSSHIQYVVDSLLQGSAFLVDHGRGVFNGLHVDNLTASIRAVLEHPGTATGFYNVADPDTVTWRDLYAVLAKVLDVDLGRVPSIAGDRFPWSTRAVLEAVQAAPIVNDIYHRVKAVVPHRQPRAAWRPDRSAPARSGSTSDGTRRARVDREMWHLQRTPRKLSSDKLLRQFAIEMPVSFEAGIQTIVDRLETIG